MRRRLASTCVLLLASFAARADVIVPPAAIVKSPDMIDFHASGSLPPGAEYHLMYEDKTSHAVTTLVRMPRGYFLPAHSHSFDELIFVQKGKLILGIGGQEKTLDAGGYAVIPAGTDFTMKAAGFSGAQFIASLNGPFDIKPAKISP